MPVPFLLMVWTLLGMVVPSAAQPASPGEEKLREALRTVTLQLRTAQSESAAATADKAAAEVKNAELTRQLEQANQQVTAAQKVRDEGQEAAARLQAQLQSRLEAAQQQLARLGKSLEEWKAAHAGIAALAKKKEAARAEAAAKNAALERRVADLRTRNTDLFKTANEILDRYRKFSLGEALAAREPFTGLTRVKLQNQLQEYSEKLLDQTSNP